MRPALNENLALLQIHYLKKYSFRSKQKVHARLQDTAAVYRRASFLWDVSIVRWYLVTDVSGQPIGPIFKGQALPD